MGRPCDTSRSAEPDDAGLLRSVGAGSEPAFRTLFDRWSPRLGRFLFRVAGSRETGEDLLQEAFVRIVHAAPRFEPRGSVGAWMYRICANLAYSHWRRQRARAAAIPCKPLVLESLPATSAEAPDRMRLSRAFSEDVGRALERLSRNHRVVFLLKAQQGLTYAEIGEILQCPEGTAKSRFHYAVRHLRAALQEWRPRGVADSSAAPREHPGRARPREVQP
ncbi:MAG: RNA polymerase sigma factor [Candidatus Eisenbacteria sp.]|nr:RNA polymerase sigma factor [Candidatus Eisenbacteria bacterium]